MGTCEVKKDDAVEFESAPSRPVLCGRVYPPSL